MIDTVVQLLSDYTFQIVALGAISLGIISGIAGTFAVLRKQSLLGDSIAHASLAGIAIAFMITQTRSTIVLLLGALVFGIISTYVINFFARNTRVNFESSLALVMSSLFGLGLMLLTQIQKMPNANQAGLEKFLFGQAATILISDVIFTLIIMCVMIVTVLLFYKELELFSFDPIFSKTVGFNEKILSFIVSTFVVSSVIAGIQMVGVVLISALLIAPAVASRQWTQRLTTMLVLSCLFGAVSGLTGTIISSTVDKFPTGPAIVIVASIIVIVSLLIAPGRGILNKKLRAYRAKISFQADMVLVHYFDHHNHDLNEIFDFDVLYQQSVTDHNVNLTRSRLLNDLEARLFLEKADRFYKLTPKAKHILFGEKGEDHESTN